jgi:hypothetical protein
MSFTRRKVLYTIMPIFIPMTMKTALTRATSKSESLRTTVPAGIVKQFNLTEDDELVWDMKPQKNKLIIIVEVAHKESNKQ